MDWSSDPNAPLLAVSGRGSQIQVFNDEGDKMEPVRARCDDGLGWDIMSPVWRCVAVPCRLFSAALWLGSVVAF